MAAWNGHSQGIQGSGMQATPTPGFGDNSTSRYGGWGSWLDNPQQPGNVARERMGGRMIVPGEEGLYAQNAKLDAMERLFGNLNGGGPGAGLSGASQNLNNALGPNPGIQGGQVGGLPAAVKTAMQPIAMPQSSTPRTPEQQAALAQQFGHAATSAQNQNAYDMQHEALPQIAGLDLARSGAIAQNRLGMGGLLSRLDELNNPYRDLISRLG